MLTLIGFNGLPEKERIQELAHTYYRILDQTGEHAASLHVKSYKKLGRRHKYSVHVRYHYPGGVLITSSAAGWDVREALHKVFQNAELQLRRQHETASAAEA